MPNCKKQEDKAERMKQFPSRADWEGVIPQACFPRMFSSTGLPSSFPCPRQVPLKSRRLNALRPRSDSVLCLACGRVDGKGNDYWAGAQCKESRGGELSRHLDRTALDGEEVAPRSGLSMSHFTPYTKERRRDNARQSGDTMMRRRIKGLNSVDRNEQARKGEVEVRISGWGIRELRLGNKSDTRGCDKTASAASERRAFWITNVAAGSSSFIKHLRSHSSPSELWLALASLLIQPRSLWPLPRRRRRLQHSDFPPRLFLKATTEPQQELKTMARLHFPNADKSGKWFRRGGELSSRDFTTHEFHPFSI